MGNLNLINEWEKAIAEHEEKKRKKAEARLERKGKYAKNIFKLKKKKGKVYRNWKKSMQGKYITEGRSEDNQKYPKDWD